MKEKILNLKFFIKILIIILVVSFQSHSENRKPITLVFRYDDFSYNINIEKYIINVFNKNNLPITFGIVPGGGHLNKSDIDVLKNTDKKKEVEIALHGFAHKHSELFGSYSEQYKLLKKGKKILERNFNSNVITFIPPYNSYSQNTIKVLNALKFKVISSDKRGPFNDSRLIFLPSTSKLGSLRQDIATARNLKLNNCIIVVLFHHFDFFEANKTSGKITRKDFDNLIEWVSEQNDIEVKTIGQASNLIFDKNFVNYNEIPGFFLFPVFYPLININLTLIYIHL